MVGAGGEYEVRGALRTFRKSSYSVHAEQAEPGRMAHKEHLQGRRSPEPCWLTKAKGKKISRRRMIDNVKFCQEVKSDED